MTLPFPAEDAPRLLRDAEPAVARAARRALEGAFRTADDRGLCELTWGLAATDADEAIDLVLPLVGHPNPTLRELAVRCLQSLHALTGLPSMGPVPEVPGDFMAEWLAPRERFRASLGELLRKTSADASPLLDALAMLPGEQEVIAGVVQDVRGIGGASEYRAQAKARASRRAPVQLILALTYRCNRGCPGCYSRESARAMWTDMDADAALRLLDWAVDRGTEVVSFTGGEPTEHPQFLRLCSAVRERGLGLYLNTSGLFGDEVALALGSDFVQNVGFNVGDRGIHRPGDLARIERHVDTLRSAGVDVFVRHTICGPSDAGEVEWIIGDFCRRLRIRHINLALAFPSGTAMNRHVPAHALLDCKPVLTRALELAAATGLRVRLSKPLPLCLWSRAEYARWQRHHELMSVCSVHERGRTHDLVVNPDLTTYPCVGLPVRGPRLDAPGVEEHCGRIVDAALARVREACRGCALLAAGVCQAVCLSHCGSGAAS